jgi:DNA polymerase (family 10)
MKNLYPHINLHIHSNFSDGKNSIKEIVKKAVESNLEFIAITDHFTDSWKEWVSKLKNEDVISEYLTEIIHWQNHLKEINEKLILLKGLEIDLLSSEQFIKKIKPAEFDLIIFEYLENIDNLAFLKNIISYWKRELRNLNDFPILGLAHFDPSYFIYDNLDVLISFLRDNQIYFEFNSSYPQYYARKYQIFYEELRKAGIFVAVGCDSHNISNLNTIEEPLEMISYYDLNQNFQKLVSKLNKKFQR